MHCPSCLSTEVHTLHGIVRWCTSCDTQWGVGKSYKKKLQKGISRIREVEHYIGSHVQGREAHVAVVVDVNNNAFVGVARRGRKDAYNKRVGREIAVGRALTALLQDAVVGVGKDDITVFAVPPGLEKRALRDYCRGKVVAVTGITFPFYPPQVA